MGICEQIDWSAIEKARAHEQFNEQCWLTFYLSGQPENLRRSFPALREINASNLEGEDFAWVYAKVPTTLDRVTIEEKISAVFELEARHEISIGGIDLDATEDVETSKFFTLKG